MSSYDDCVCFNLPDDEEVKPTFAHSSFSSKYQIHYIFNNITPGVNDLFPDFQVSIAPLSWKMLLIRDVDIFWTVLLLPVTKLVTVIVNYFLISTVKD